MTTWIAEVTFFVAIIVVVVIHEAAHFSVAKHFRIKVDEFFVGFGPRLWSFRRGETEYGLKAILVGGYVRIAGMNPFEEVSPEDEARTFGAKPIRQRAAVIAAGPATHFVIASVMFALWLGIVGTPSYTSSTSYVNGIIASIDGVALPAQAAGLEIGDHVVAIDGVPVSTQADFKKAVDASGGTQALALTVVRGGSTISIPVTPVMVPKAKAPYVGVELGAFLLPRKHSGFLGSITGGFKMLWETVVQVVTGLRHVFDFPRLFSLVFGSAHRSVNDVTSVIGASQIAGQVAKRDPGDLLQIFGLVNVFVGVLNLLPILPFDGGHLAVLVVEGLRGKRVDPRRLVPVSAVFAGLLITFMIMIVYLDIVKPVPFGP